MTRAIKVALFVLFFVFIQVSFLELIEVWGSRPDFLISLVVYCALTYTARGGISIGFLSGLLLDVYEPNNIGSHAISYSISSWIIGAVKGDIYRESRTIRILLVGLGEVIHEVIRGIILWNKILFSKNIISYEILTIIYTILVSIIILPLIEKWLK